MKRPRACLGCGRHRAAKGSPLCGPCWQLLPPGSQDELRRTWDAANGLPVPVREVIDQARAQREAAL